MESTETGALYERILALVPVDKLHDSCNNILQEEIAPIDREVTDLKKAFAKIDDIRDAVIKLEQGSTSTGIRSVSLLEVMGSTMALQETLQKTLEKMTTGMAVDEKRFEKRRVRTDDTAEERKRKRESSIDENCGRSATASDLSSSESESESGSDTDSETHEEARDDVELNVADTSLKDTQSVKKRFLIDGETFLQDVATEFQRVRSPLHLKATVEDVNTTLSQEEKAFIIPKVLIALKESVDEDVSCSQPIQICSSLRAVVGWATAPVGHNSIDLDAYYDYAKAIQAYAARLSDSTYRVDFERLVNDFLTALSTINVSARAIKHPTNGMPVFSDLVKNMNEMKVTDRSNNLVKMVAAYMVETASYVGIPQSQRILESLEMVERWMHKDPPRESELHRYRILIRAIPDYANRVPNMVTQKSILRLHNRMFELARMTPLTDAQKCARFKRWAVQVLAEAKHWLRNGRVDVNKIGSAITLMDCVMSQPCIAGWKPWADPIVNECAMAVKNCIAQVKMSSQHQSRTVRDTLLTRIAKWNLRTAAPSSKHLRF